VVAGLVMFRDGVLIPVQFVDTVLNRVCATVPGFSEFALATPTPISAPGLGLFGAAILIAALVAAGGITVMRMGAATSA
jgi:hypothetical protein